MTYSEEQCSRTTKMVSKVKCSKRSPPELDKNILREDNTGMTKGFLLYSVNKFEITTLNL